MRAGDAQAVEDIFLGRRSRASADGGHRRPPRHYDGNGRARPSAASTTPRRRRKRLITVALGAGIVIVLLLITASEWRGWRSRASVTCAPAQMTDDIFLKLSLLHQSRRWCAAWSQRAAVPEILVLVVVGARVGGLGARLVDVPLDSLGAQGLFTLGRVVIPVIGG